MSGGSFNYLYSRVNRGEMPSARQVEHMLAAIRGYTGSGAAAADTALVIRKLREAAALMEGLADVWHDVEWHHSGDYLMETVLATLAEYESAPPYEDRLLHACRVLYRHLKTIQANHRYTVECAAEFRQERDEALETVRELRKALDRKDKP